MNCLVSDLKLIKKRVIKTDKLISDRQITITVQGDNFNTSLSEIYLGSEYNIFNTTYFIPISKYMPDTVVKIIFR